MQSPALDPAGWPSRCHTYLLKHRWPVLTAVLCVWLVCLWLGSQARTDNSALAFFPDSDPQIQAMAQGMDIAPFSRLLLVDFAATDEGQTARLAASAAAVLQALPPNLVQRTGRFILPQPQALLQLLPSLVDEQSLQALEKAASADTLSNTLRTTRDAMGGLWGSISVPWVQYDPLNFRQSILKRLPAPPTTALPGAGFDFPVSADGKHMLLTLRPSHSLHDVNQALQLMNALNAALLSHVPPDIKVTVVGGHRHSAANTQSINADIRRIVFLSLAGFVLIYTLLVRSVGGTCWLLLTPLAAAGIALGSVSLFWPVISGLALGFGASVLGIAEDYAVHTHFALRTGRTQHKSTGAVLNILAQPLFQGFILNISGFVVLLFSGIPALRQLATFALITLSVGFLLAVFILPLCSGFASPALPVQSSATSKKHPRLGPVLLCIFCLLVWCAGFGQQLHVDVSPRSMGADMAAIQKDATHLNAVWGGNLHRLWVVQGQDLHQTLADTQQVAQALRAKNEQISTLAELWPSPHEAKANIQRWKNFVASHPHLAAQVEAAGQEHGFAPDTFAPFARLLATPPKSIDASLLREAGLGELVDTFLLEDMDKAGQPRILSLIIGQAPTTSHMQEDTAAKILELLPDHVQSNTVMLSPAGLEAALLRHLEREQWLLPVLAAVCLFLLYFCFRDVRRTLLASLPPLVALASILGWLVLSGSTLTLAAMASFPLVLGLAVDHGLMVTHDLGQGVSLGIHRAVLTSSLTALTGMGLLALAQHPALRSMGEIIFLGLTAEMLAALWLLPLLCKEEKPA